MDPTTDSTWTQRRYSLMLVVVCLGLGLLLHDSALERDWLLLAHRHAWLPEQFWLFATQWGDSAQALVLLMAIFLLRPLWLSLSFKTWLMGAPASPLLKSAWDSVRPLSVLDSQALLPIGQPPMVGHAMPSGHAMAAGSMAALLFFSLNERSPHWRLLVLVAGAVVALSRVSVGAHWPGDVLAGFGLGWALVLLAQVWERYQPWASALHKPRTQVLALLLQAVLLVVLWKIPSEGPGMTYARLLVTGLAGVAAVRVWRGHKQRVQARGGAHV